MTTMFEALHGAPVRERWRNPFNHDRAIAAAGNVEKLSLWLEVPMLEVKRAYIHRELMGLVRAKLRPDAMPVPPCPVDLDRLRGFLKRAEDRDGYLHGRRHMLKMFQELVQWATEVVE